MSENKPEYILSPGQPSLEKKYNERVVRMSVSLPESMHKFICDREARQMPAAEYIRQLIDQAIEADSKPLKGD